MNKKYIVKLTEQERQSLEALVNRGRVAVRKLKRAWILLQADAGDAGPSWPDEPARLRCRADDHLPGSPDAG